MVTDVTTRDERLTAWRDFLMTYKVVLTTLEREMQAEIGLPLAWFDILGKLRQAPRKRLRLQVLAEAVMLSRSGISRLVDRMVDANLVRRAPCREDRRGTYAVVTADGEAAFLEASPGHFNRVREHFVNHLTQEDAEGLRRALGKVLDAAGHTARPLWDAPVEDAAAVTAG